MEGGGPVKDMRWSKLVRAIRRNPLLEDASLASALEHALCTACNLQVPPVISDAMGGGEV